MAKKRTGIFVNQEVYDQIRTYCRSRDLVMARWVENICLEAIRAKRVPVESRPPPPDLGDPGGHESDVPVWSRPPFWHRA